MRFPEKRIKFWALGNVNLPPTGTKEVLLAPAPTTVVNAQSLNGPDEASKLIVYGTLRCTMQ